jgi:hypothetical protein
MGLPVWPVFGLDDSDGPGVMGQGWISGSSHDQDRLLAVRADYRPPGARERLLAQTQPAVQRTPILSAVLSQLDDDEGRPLNLFRATTIEEATSPYAVVIVDGVPVSAVSCNDGISTAWCLSTQGVTVLLGPRRGTETLRPMRLSGTGRVRQPRVQRLSAIRRPSIASR